MTGRAAAGGYPRRPVRAVIQPLLSDHRCDRCGYQIATAPPFPRCPMCGARDWKGIAAERRPDREVAQA